MNSKIALWSVTKNFVGVNKKFLFPKILKKVIQNFFRKMCSDKISLKHELHTPTVLHTHIHTYTYTHTHTHTCTHTHAHAHARTRTCRHTHTVFISHTCTLHMVLHTALQERSSKDHNYYG